MKIDCTQCEMYRTEHCDDCLVTALLHPPADAVEIESEFEPGLEALSGAGLIPILKFRPREPNRLEEGSGEAAVTGGP